MTCIRTSVQSAARSESATALQGNDGNLCATCRDLVFPAATLARTAGRNEKEGGFP